MDAPLLPPNQDCWLTRDRNEGELAADVEVWVVKPEPLLYADGDVTWVAPLDIVDRRATFYGAVSAALARAEVGNGVPGTARECLHVARGPRG